MTLHGDVVDARYRYLSRREQSFVIAVPRISEWIKRPTAIEGCTVVKSL